MPDDEVTIAPRFNGPPGSANGGYACGVVAAAIGPSAQVSLRLPPPLGVPLGRRVGADGSVRLLDGEAVVAEGRPGRPAGDVPAAPQLSDAERASARAGWRRPEAHPYPGCFVCGPLREGDGLRLLAGPVKGDAGLLACPWCPAEELAAGDEVDPVFVWAALDCPSGFACIPAGTSTVLASMTATLEAPLRPGGDYVVTAWPLGSEGRKHRAGSAIHEAGGRRVAWAETLWITLRAG
jgi:hypothetical protein